MGLSLLTGCTSPSPAPRPSPTTPAATTPAPTTPSATPVPRTLGPSNRVRASDLPDPDGGGRIEAYARHRRSLDHLSRCQPAPLASLRAAQTSVVSFRAVASGSNPASSPLAGQPTSYVVALQFADETAARRAYDTVRGWGSTCRAQGRTADGVRLRSGGTDWTAVPAPPATAEVAEVVYRGPGSTAGRAYWESTGLVLVGDRLALTVHLFYAAESVYSLVITADDEEAGFPHPQRGLTAATATALAR
ncbi:MAG: hypothetical protein JWP61_27 [Friedmanniella sp.]|nr:hypothetical protein [Friedmanniella sp.]